MANRNRWRQVLPVGLLVVLAGCSGAAAVPTTRASAAPSRAASTAAPAAPQAGDLRVSTRPLSGSIDACERMQRATAQAAEPWIRADGTWDPSAKPTVPGAVAWPAAHYAVTLDGPRRILTSNDLPAGVTTGIFPVAPGGPAAQYDQGSAAIRPQSFSWTVESNPVSRDIPACLPSGAIGVLSNGVVLYRAVDGSGRDTVAHELDDSCGGRPDSSGVYHYDSVGSCIAALAPIPAISPDHAALAGYALDGFGIYVERDRAGALLTNRDLDACHGRISWVPWDGRIALIYHYVVTAEYPYTLGCLRGTGTGNAWDNHDPNT